MTALMTACKKNDIDVMNVLLNARHHSTEWLDAQADDGNTALMLAAAKGNTRYVDLLLRAGARVDIVNAQGCSVFHCAANEDISNLLVAALPRDFVAGDNTVQLMSEDIVSESVAEGSGRRKSRRLMGRGAEEEEKSGKRQRRK
jgi:ankyrin repeat protein